MNLRSTIQKNIEDALETLAKKGYDANQPRAADGTWTATGSGSSGGVEKSKAAWVDAKNKLEFEKEKTPLDSWEDRWGTRGVGNIYVEAERSAYYKYVDTLPEAEYMKIREGILNSFLDGNAVSSLSEKDRKAFLDTMREGTDFISFDMLDQLKQQGLKVVQKDTPDYRPNYQSETRTINMTNEDSLEIHAHEFAHAIDSLVLPASRGMPMPHGSVSITGLLWYQDNNFISSPTEALALAKEYHEFHSGRTGAFNNGDGAYFKGNWVWGNYEGRIYDRNGTGQEWWAMNVQKYSTYRRNPSESIQRDWGKAQIAYPKLTKKIESLFDGSRIKGDWK